MAVHSFPRAVLILASISVCTARIHHQTTDVSGTVTEVNRCLRLVQIAASRRGDSAPAPRAIEQSQAIENR